MHLLRPIAVCLLLLGPMTTAFVQASPPTAPIDAAEKRAVVEALGKQMNAKYVFPVVAAKVAVALAAKDLQGEYKQIHTAQAFAKALSTDVRALAQDRHFGVLYDPNFKFPSANDLLLPPTTEQVAEARKETVRDGFGIARVERLPGNVGYLDIRNFGSAEFVGAAYASAIDLVSGTDALILDLRQNDGGDAHAVAYLLSFFFPVGDSRHLNDMYSRGTDSTQQYWTIPLPDARYTRPVYVLTSAYTFSGGEECAYDFQTQKRATLVGEVTYGGANPPTPASLGYGFVAFVANDRPINPITKTNWGNVGVRPDIAVPAADAMKTAYVAILKTLIPKAKDDHERDDLKATLARVAKDESEKLHYAYISTQE